MLQTLNVMSTNSIKTIALITFQCCPIAACYNTTTFVIIQCINVVKRRAINILCLHSSIVCSKNRKRKKQKKIMKEKKRKEKDHKLT
jgi:hypothetical protein